MIFAYCPEVRRVRYVWGRLLGSIVAVREGQREHNMTMSSERTCKCGEDDTHLSFYIEAPSPRRAPAPLVFGLRARSGLSNARKTGWG